MNTQIPSLAVYHANFTAFGTDYTLIPASGYRLAGTDGLNLGTSWFGASAGGGNTLPSPWLATDIGNVGLSGSTSESSGTWTIMGAGADVGGVIDALQYAYQSASGDCQIIAHLVSAGANTEPFDRAGIMIRASTAADASHVMLGLRSGPAAQPIGLVERDLTGDVTIVTDRAAAISPTWFKLARVGATVAGSISTDGVNWTLVASTSTCTLPTNNVLLGLIVTSNDIAVLKTAVFDQVTVTTPLPIPWVNADVGPVTLAGSTMWANGIFTVTGSGANVGTTIDAFQYCWQTWVGDFQLIAKIASVTGLEPFSRVGVMLRASVASDAAHVLLGLRPGGPNNVGLVTRLTTGATTTIVNTLPWATTTWFKMRRIGASVTGWVSAEGINWLDVGTLTTTIPSTATIGLIVLSNDITALNTATFEQVTASGGADLGLSAVRSISGRLLIMPSNPTLLINLAIGERYRLAEALTQAITLLVGVSDEVLRASANTVSRILDLAGVGEVAFVVGSDYATNVTSVTANVRVSGSSTVVATQALGKPTADGNHVCIVDLTTTFAGLAAGNYTVSILFTGPGGSTDSAESAPFAVPV